MRLGIACSLVLLVGCRTAPPPRAVPVAAAPVAPLADGGPCRADEVTLRFEGRDGQYTGMSHDGALLVLQNKGTRECTVAKRPALSFTNAAGKAVALQLSLPPGMHPGPVLVPVKLAPGAIAQGTLRWVNGEVYDKSACVDVAKASLSVEGGVVIAPLSGHVCGQAGTTPKYEQEWMALGDGDASK